MLRGKGFIKVNIGCRNKNNIFDRDIHDLSRKIFV